MTVIIKTSLVHGFNLLLFLRPLTSRVCFDYSCAFPVAPHSGCSWLLKALVQAGNIARVPGRLTCPHTDSETNLSYRTAGRWIH